MKQILYQLGPQTYSAQFENSILGHRCRKKVAIPWLPNFKHIRRLGYSQGNTLVLKASRMPKCLADWSTHGAMQTANIKELNSCTQTFSSVSVEKQNWTTATESNICCNVVRLLKYKQTPIHLPKHSDIPHLPVLSQLLPRLNLPSW